MSMMINVVMIGSGIAAVVLLRKAKEVSWAKPVAVACAALTLLLAVGRILSPLGNAANNLQATHDRYEEVCGAFLGASLAARHPGSRVVILAPPQMTTTGPDDGLGTQALTDSLQKALAGKVASVKVRHLEIPEDVKAQSQAAGPDGDMMTDMLLVETSRWFDSEGLARLLEELREEADLVISTVNLNRGVGAGVLPPADGKPAVVLLNASLEDVGGMLQDTALDTIVLHRADTEARKTGPLVTDNVEESFNRRYLLVTQENVESLAGQLP